METEAGDETREELSRGGSVGAIFQNMAFLLADKEQKIIDIRRTTPPIFYKVLFGDGA